MSNTGAADSLQNARERMTNTVGEKRLSALFDEGSFLEIDRFALSGNAGVEAAAGFGTVEGCPVYAFAQNSDLSGGAISRAQAQKIQKIFTLAAQNGAPVVGIYDSIGGRLQEGGSLLEDYGGILQKTNALSGVVPQISLILGPCIGASAMIAACADFVVMSQNAELTISSGGEDGAAVDAAKRGEAALVLPTEEAAVAAARSLLAKLPANNLDAVGFDDENDATGILQAGISAKEAAQAVSNAGSLQELSALFGASAFTALAGIGGISAGVVAYDGVLDADSCVKAARFIRFCDAFHIPVLSFVNADKFISLRAASMLSDAYAEATTAKISVLVGKAYGSVYLATAGCGANADYTMAWPDAVVSALAPETGAAFLWNDRLADSADPIGDRKKLIAQYAHEEGSPLKAAGYGLIETVVLPQETRDKLLHVLDMLSSKRVSTMPKKHNNIQL